MSLGTVIFILAGLAGVIFLFKTFMALFGSLKSESYFGRNQAKENYIRAVEEHQSDEYLRSLLIKRAAEGTRRFAMISEEKPSITNLRNMGAISGSMYKAFEQAESETLDELVQVKYEAECLKEGWSRSILQEASKHLKIKAAVANGKRLAVR